MSFGAETPEAVDHLQQVFQGIQAGPLNVAGPGLAPLPRGYPPQTIFLFNQQASMFYFKTTREDGVLEETINMHTKTRMGGIAITWVGDQITEWVHGNTTTWNPTFSGETTLLISQIRSEIRSAAWAR